MSDWNRGAALHKLALNRAQQRISEITLKYAQTSELRKSDGSVRHKCFISYHAEDAEEALTFIEGFESVMIPRSIGVSDDDGPLIQSTDNDYIMNRIRSKYLGDSTVTIVLVGKCTWARKFIDWEVYSSIRPSATSSLNGLLAIELPSVAGKAKLPERIYDNVPTKDKSSAYGSWMRYPATVGVAQKMIEDAFQARTQKAQSINNRRERKINNSPCD